VALADDHACTTYPDHVKVDYRDMEPDDQARTTIDTMKIEE